MRINLIWYKSILDWVFVNAQKQNIDIVISKSLSDKRGLISYDLSYLHRDHAKTAIFRESNYLLKSTNDR